MQKEKIVRKREKRVLKIKMVETHGEKKEKKGKKEKRREK